MGYAYENKNTRQYMSDLNETISNVFKEFEADIFSMEIYKLPDDDYFKQLYYREWMNEIDNYRRIVNHCLDTQEERLKKLLKIKETT